MLPQIKNFPPMPKAKPPRDEFPHCPDPPPPPPPNWAANKNEWLDNIDPEVDSLDCLSFAGVEGVVLIQTPEEILTVRERKTSSTVLMVRDD